MKVISISKGGMELARVQLDQPLLTIGRSPTCDVSLRAPGIKSVHYVLEWSGTGEFSGEMEHQGSWILFDITGQPSADTSTQEGTLLSANKVELKGLIFKLVTDRLETKAKIGGRIAASLKKGPMVAQTGYGLALELVQIHADSGAIEAINYVPPSDLKKPRNQIVFRNIPQFRVRSTPADVILDLHDMQDAQVFSRGQMVPIKNYTVPVSWRDILHVKWQNMEFFVRFVSAIHIPPIEHEVIGDAQLKRFYAMGILLGAFVFIAAGLLSPSDTKPDLNPRRLVQIKVPEARPEPPPPPPKVVEKPPEKPPEKIVEKIQPKKPELIKEPAPARPEPKKQIAKQKPAPEIIKAKPKLPPARSQAKGNPRLKNPPKASASMVGKAGPISQAKFVTNTPPPPTAAQIAAAESKAAEQKVAASLKFLSGPNTGASKSVKVAASQPNPGNNVPSTLREQAKLGNQFNRDTEVYTNQGPIDTKGSRSFTNEKGASIGGNREGAGSIQGKVNLSTGTGKGLEGTVSGGGGGGLLMSGLGTADASEIENAINKNLRKFQYCYEKALLGDPNIGGTVQIAWSIITSGRAQNVRIKNSQIRNADLMTCMKNELSKIAFPSPKGGNVEVEYPFAFSASKL